MTEQKASPTPDDFYVIGGTLRRDAPSYVRRQADDDLYNGLTAGQFCYVLTSRQMGKSSLMVRTAVRLRADKVSVAVLDLTAIGQNVTAEQWYEGLLGLIGEQLGLEDELEGFWLANKRIGPLQRWIRAIREVVMECRERIVIFVDEIDAVRSLPFSTDEFFAGIREVYNRRSEDSELTRLTFCLLGVATPSDLIRDTRMTPFNIGQRIELTDFTELEAAPLEDGLKRTEKLNKELLRRILYWTGGHPYLTQRLCGAVSEDFSVTKAAGVDRVCEVLFLSPRAQATDGNLLFVRDRMLRSELDLSSLLDLYAQVHGGRKVEDDITNPLVNVLRLSGIGRALDGQLYVRNRIYERVFDQRWVTNFMPGAELRRQRVAYRKGQLQFVSVAVQFVLVLAIIGMAGMIISFFGNRALIADATARGMRVDEITRADLGKDVIQKDSTATRVELEAVDRLREILSQLDAYDRGSPPLYLRFGFYSGNDIAPYLRGIYFGAVEERFKKPTVKRLEEDLSNFAAGQPSVRIPRTIGSGDVERTVLGFHYDLLKAYLMLQDAARLEPTFLAPTIAEYWKRTAPADTEILSLQQLDFYARQLVRDDAPHIKVDAKIVADVRSKLTAYPAVNRFYKRVVTEINAKAAPVSIDTVIEVQGPGPLAGTHTVPGSYTLDGYRNYMKSTIENAGEEISKDDWVMGTPAANSTQTPSTDLSKLQVLYMLDYTDHWRTFVRGINVRPFKSRDHAVKALNALSAADSPMERVILAVARNTNLSAKPEGRGLWGWIKSWFSSGSGNEWAGNSEVEKEFRPLLEFVSSGETQKDTSPMLQYRAVLYRVRDLLEVLPENQFQHLSQTLLTGKDDLGLVQAQQSVSGLLEGFKTAAATDTATLLKQPFENLRALLYGGGYELIAKEWNEQIYPKAQALESQYPFADTGEEASLTDLTRFLNPVNGQFSTFFNQRLASSFDDTQGEWKLKESGAIKFSDDFVKYLNNARKLREALFASGGEQPEVPYDLVLQPLVDTNIVIEIEIDGTRVETRGTSVQSARFIWPAGAGSSGGTITVILIGGQTVQRVFPGNWGLFKMLEVFSAAGKFGKKSDQFPISWRVGSVPVRAVLQPSGSRNPFERTLFTSLHAPPNLLGK